MNRGTPLQSAASLHEKAVQAVASGEVAPMPNKRGKGPEKPFQPPVDTHVKVNPLVWKAAKALLKGSYTELQIIDENTVRVL